MFNGRKIILKITNNYMHNHKIIIRIIMKVKNYSKKFNLKQEIIIKQKKKWNQIDKILMSNKMIIKFRIKIKQKISRKIKLNQNNKQ